MEILQACTNYAIEFSIFIKTQGIVLIIEAHQLGKFMFGVSS